jgi:hypothetical protein
MLGPPARETTCGGVRMRTAPCVNCGEATAILAAGTWREIEGWEQVRRQGGTNAVRYRRLTGSICCPSCMSLRTKQVHQDQGELFGS